LKRTASERQRTNLGVQQYKEEENDYEQEIQEELEEEDDDTSITTSNILEEKQEDQNTDQSNYDMKEGMQDNSFDAIIHSHFP
jgi:hypothetical protein